MVVNLPERVNGLSAESSLVVMCGLVYSVQYMLLIRCKNWHGRYISA
jgi:hypothetical protein